MDLIIQSTLHTLEKSKNLLNCIEDENLCNASIGPYYSTIGTHIRHILNFYESILNVDNNNVIDLTARNRNTSIETNCTDANNYLNSIIDRLIAFNVDFNKKVTVIDDLGMGKIEMPYTLAAVFSQANSHTIHHYAIINYILDRLGVTFNDGDFGYNPTTPKQIVSD